MSLHERGQQKSFRVKAVWGHRNQTRYKEERPWEEKSFETLRMGAQPFEAWWVNTCFVSCLTCVFALGQHKQCTKNTKSEIRIGKVYSISGLSS